MEYGQRIMEGKTISKGLQLLLYDTLRYWKMHVAVYIPPAVGE